MIVRPIITFNIKPVIIDLFNSYQIPEKPVSSFYCLKFGFLTLLMYNENALECYIFNSFMKTLIVIKNSLSVIYKSEKNSQTCQQYWIQKLGRCWQMWLFGAS